MDAPSRVVQTEMNAFERFWLPIAGLTAAAVVVAAVVALPSSDATEELLVAAERTSEVRSARLAMSGDISMDISFGDIPFPTGGSLGGAELPEDFPMADLGQEFEQDIDEVAGEVGRLLEEGLSFEATIDAEGALVVPDRMQMSGTVVTTTPSIDLPSPGPVEFGVVLIGDRAWFMLPDGGWVVVPNEQAPFGPLVLDADTFTTFMRSPAGPVDDLGIEDLDGERVRHLRFEVDAEELAEDAGVTADEFGVEGRWSADVWIGVADDLVRRFDVASQGSFSPEAGEEQAAFGDVDGSWSMTMSVRMSDFGADIAIEPPPADQVREQAGDAPDPFAFLAPFGGQVSVGTD